MKKLFLFSSLLLILGLTAISFAQNQVASGTWGINTSTTDYTLATNEGERSMTVNVSFAEPFDMKPDVVVGVTMLDASNQTMIRYSVTPMAISRDGFSIKVATWGDTQLMGIKGFWLAHATATMGEE